MKLLILIILYISSCLSIAAEESIYDYIHKAEIATQQLELKVAEIHLKNTIKAYPNNPLSHIKMAEYYVHIGQGSLADIEIKNAIKYKAKHKDLIILKMKSHLIQGQFSQITKQNTPLLNMPINKIARIRALQGIAYLNQNEIEKAKHLFKRAYRLGKNEFEVQVATARLYQLEDKKIEAKKLIEKLYKHYPYTVDVLLLVGNLYRDEQNYPKAYTAFANASKIQPGNIASWLGMVTSSVGQNNYDEADLRIKKVLELNPKYELAYYLQALIAYRLNNQAKARQAISLLLKINPEHKGILWIDGALDYRKKRYDNAQIKLEEYIEFNPNHFQSSKMLAAIYIKKKRETDAIKLLQVHEKYWDHITYSILGDAYRQLGNNIKSTEFYEKATLLAPKDKQLQSKILINKLSRGEDISADIIDDKFENLEGVGYPNITQLLLKNEVDKAIKIINTYLTKQPNEYRLYHLLGICYLKNEDLQQAQLYFKKVIILETNYIPAYLSLAKIYLQEDKKELARKKYKQILAIKPNHEIATLNMAKLSQLDKNYPQMIKWLNKARNYDLYATAPRLLLNQYYLASNQVKKALELTNELVDSYPDNTAYLKLHADNLYVNKDLDFAVITYKKIVKLNPDSAQAYFWLGSAEYIWKDYKNAKIHLEKALALNPDIFIAQVTLIKLALKEKKLNGTLTQSTKLITKYPKSSLAYEILGDTQLAHKQVKEALISFIKAYKLAPDNSLIMNKLAHLHAKIGNLKQSIILLNDWLDKHPKDLKSRMALALIYQKTNQLALSQKHYEYILSTQPKNTSVINNLALVYEQQNDPRSFEFAEVAYSLAPNDVSIIDTLGWMLVKNGELDRGLGLLRKAAKLAPSELDVVYHYAVALDKSGNKLLAKKNLDLITEMTGQFHNRSKAKALLKKLNGK